MEKLAILGGEPVRQKPFTPWPQYTAADVQRLIKVVESAIGEVSHCPPR